MGSITVQNAATHKKAVANTSTTKLP